MASYSSERVKIFTPNLLSFYKYKMSTENVYNHSDENPADFQWKFGCYNVQAYSTQIEVQILLTGGTISNPVTSFSSLGDSMDAQLAEEFCKRGMVYSGHQESMNKFVLMKQNPNNKHCYVHKRTSLFIEHARLPRLVAWRSDGPGVSFSDRYTQTNL